MQGLESASSTASGHAHQFCLRPMGVEGASPPGTPTPGSWVCRQVWGHPAVQSIGWWLRLREGGTAGTFPQAAHGRGE